MQPPQRREHYEEGFMSLRNSSGGAIAPPVPRTTAPNSAGLNYYNEEVERHLMATAEADVVSTAQLAQLSALILGAAAMALICHMMGGGDQHYGRTPPPAWSHLAMPHFTATGKW